MKKLIVLGLLVMVLIGGCVSKNCRSDGDFCEIHQEVSGILFQERDCLISSDTVLEGKDKMSRAANVRSHLTSCSDWIR